MNDTASTNAHEKGLTLDDETLARTFLILCNALPASREHLWPTEKGLRGICILECLSSTSCVLFRSKEYYSSSRIRRLPRDERRPLVPSTSGRETVVEGDEERLSWRRCDVEVVDGRWENTLIPS